MTTTVKVLVASEWQFLQPDEIRSIFHDHPDGIDKNIEYDEGHHQFAVDCVILDAQRVSEALVHIVKEYVVEQEALNEDMDELEGIRKIAPIEQHDSGETVQEQMWRYVDKLEAKLKNDTNHQAQLIPQVIAHRPGRFSRNDMEGAFPNIILADISKASHCQVDLLKESLTNQIQVTGSSQEEVDYAMLLISNAEEQYLANTQNTTFDFMETEGRKDPFLRFMKPVSYLDVQLFEPGAAPLCEVIMVAWDSASRQHRTERKPVKPIESIPQRHSLWLEPLNFPFTDEKKDPAHWLKRQAPIAHGDLSLPQIGRTEQWVSQIAGAPLDPNAPSGPAGQKPAVHRKTIRVPPPQQEMAKQFDEKIKETSDDGSTSDFAPLQAPAPANAFTNEDERRWGGPQWKYFDHSLKLAMDKASFLHKKALFFELHFGKAYIHTVSLRSHLKPPGRGKQADHWAFQGDWRNIFRVFEYAQGASTLFSRKLTQSQDDIEFFLRLRLRGGEGLFETTPKSQRAFFEITCLDTKTNDQAVIELEDGHGGTTIAGISEDAGTINFHWPARNWDCSWQLSARKQAFTPDQDAAFKVFLNNAYVMHDPEGINEPVLFTKRHPRVSVRSVRLIRETVHRAGTNLSLVVSQVKVLEVEAMSDEAFRASSAGDAQLAEAFNIWWEAKLVSARMQRRLKENQELELGGVASWDPDDAMPVLLDMLEMGDHIIPRIDDVGYMAHSAGPDGTATRSKTRNQKPGQAASFGDQSKSQAPERAPSAPKSQHPLDR